MRIRDWKGILGDEDRALLAVFRERNIPYVIAYNKSDLVVESVAVEEHDEFASVRATPCRRCHLGDKVGHLVLLELREQHHAPVGHGIAQHAACM